MFENTSVIKTLTYEVDDAKILKDVLSSEACLLSWLLHQLFNDMRNDIVVRSKQVFDKMNEE
jgi:hypothetical protein